MHTYCQSNSNTAVITAHSLRGTHLHKKGGAAAGRAPRTSKQQGGAPHPLPLTLHTTHTTRPSTRSHTRTINARDTALVRRATSACSANNAFDIGASPNGGATYYYAYIARPLRGSCLLRRRNILLVATGPKMAKNKNRREAPRSRGASAANRVNR